MKKKYEFRAYALGAMLLSGCLFVVQSWFPHIPNFFVKITLWVGFGFLVVEGVLQLLDRLKDFVDEIKG